MRYKGMRMAGLALAIVVVFTVMAKAQSETIKVGVLHSLSGTMAISETTLKDTILMMIDEQNKKGGLLGKKLEAVVVDPASNWPLFAEKAQELLEKDKVAVVFGCWTSVSRNRSCPCSRRMTACSFIPSSTRERSLRRMSSTPALHRISRPFRLSSI